MKPRLLPSLIGAACLLLGAVPFHARAGDDATGNTQTDLLDMSLADLMQVTVTSVGKKAQRLDQTAAAAFVITAEDIRRSGATRLPEILRLAPGVHVAQIDGNKWSVSVRGLGGRWAGQLLVLMDGRTLYTPLFGGVYWDVQDTLIEDIERIEIIRGPGGTLWGANAVNGVINIITKSAAATQGGLAYARVGTHENEAGARYGTTLANGAHLRAYAKASDSGAFALTDHAPYLGGRPVGTAGADAHDDWDMRRAGFRLDHTLNGGDRFTLQGDTYDGDIRQTAITVAAPTVGNALVQDTIATSGANLMLRWQRKTADGELQVQAYVDQTERRAVVLNERVATHDIEFQQRFGLGSRQEIVWGLGYRGVSFELDGSHTVAFGHPRHDTALYNFFIQDEIKLRPDLALTLGSKFEHNAYTGMEPQPNARLFWQMDDRQALWGAWSRAVRTPSRADLDITLRLTNVAPFTPLSIQGNSDLAAARLTAQEIGWRRQLRDDLNIEATAFHYDLDDFFSNEPVPGFPFSTTSEFHNRLKLQSHGLELNGTWQVNPDWRLRAGYARLRLAAQAMAGSADGQTPAQFAGSGPRHQFQLHSSARLGHNLDFDAMLYRVGTVDNGAIAAYTRLDLRLAWKPRTDVELSLVGRNLLDDRHFEYVGQDSVASDVPRSLYAQVRWSF
jgi:iron complex outermembrane receptor protein